MDTCTKCKYYIQKICAGNYSVGRSTWCTLYIEVEV